MKTDTKLLERVNYLIALADKTLASRAGMRPERVNYELFKEFQSLSSSFILNLYGRQHPYFINFISSVENVWPSDVEKGRGLLKSIKTEIEQGWLVQMKSLISAEIFSDFLEMAKYLLDEDYKDPAAVMIGSVLEENLRQIATKNGIPIDFTNNNGVQKLKKADALNIELAKSGTYLITDQKQVTAWLDLRNKAAHGFYKKYTKEQVNLMYAGVLDFISRNN